MNKGSTGSAASSAVPLKIPPQELTEAQYLDRQAQQAKEAIGRVADQIKALAKEAADPRPYVDQYPWISMGAAAVVGFLAGTVVTPARGQSLGERLSNLMPAGQEDGKKPKSAMRFVTTPLIRMARTAFISALTGATAAKVADKEQTPARPPASPYAGPPVAEGGEAYISVPT